MRHWPLAALMIAALSGVSQAHEYKLGDLLIDHPWARASIGKAPNGAAYMTITTEGAETDRLLAVESDVANRVELHNHLMVDGVMKMRPVVAIEVAPGEPTLLQPGGLHVMLMGLKAPLKKGESFPMTLVFERAGKVEVEIKIEDATETGAPADQEHDHGS